MARRLLAALLVVALAACSSSGEGDDDAAPVAEPAEERIEPQVVPLPDTVASPRFPWWSADGERLLFSGIPDGGERAEIMSVAPDGSDLTCLTCGIAPEVVEPLLKPIAFADGQRIAVRVGNQSPGTAADHAILECLPDVSRCEEAVLVPLVPPAASDPSVEQDQRELRVAPDGEHVGFSQVRLAPDGSQALVAIVGRLVRTEDAYEIEDPRVVSARGELESFTPDGRGVLVAVLSPGPYEMANPDVVSIDLATGEVGRVTSAPDYDEPVELSPDGSSYVVGSGRGSGLFETVSQVRRPSLLGSALDPLTTYLFTNHRAELLEGWMVPVGAEADGTLGQRIPSPPGGQDARPIWNWRPDGTAITWWEGRGSGLETDESDTRLVVAELPDRRPVGDRPPVEVPDPGWAPSLAGFVPEVVPVPRSRAGSQSGSVIVEVTQAGGALVVQLSYLDFSDDGEWVINGTERADRRDGATTYAADLVLSGDHDGFLRAIAVISIAGIEGEITSEVDGRQLALPVPDEPGG